MELLSLQSRMVVGGSVGGSTAISFNGAAFITKQNGDREQSTLAIDPRFNGAALITKQNAVVQNNVSTGPGRFNGAALITKQNVWNPTSMKLMAKLQWGCFDYKAECVTTSSTCSPTSGFNGAALITKQNDVITGLGVQGLDASMGLL